VPETAPNELTIIERMAIQVEIADFQDIFIWSPIVNGMS